MLDERALGECGVDDGLGRDGLAATLALIRGDDHARLGVLDAVAERLGGKAREDDGVDSSETRAREEGDRGFGDPGRRREVSMRDGGICSEVRTWGGKSRQSDQGFQTAVSSPLGKLGAVPRDSRLPS